MNDPKKTAAPQAPAKPNYAPLLEALRAEPLSFASHGAALFVAHALVDLGDRAVSTMTPAGIVAHATDFLHRVPMAWPAFRMGNPGKLVNALKLYGIPHETAEHYRAEIDRIQPSPVAKELTEQNRAHMERLQRGLESA